ncbi:hypothetical protein [Dethiosulfatarculus sandiegensis]|uniref:DUF2802 domain-containing protein n=1 Tax=Dethiosulfatarculus sandiegensis TaxID=1429043 RepID=A0A0D2HSP4_9BACT|nr:hypothetical protein [Dethiosulfatarculus sandiegensis]KIX13528.1 hypothetical protein X474_13665 [Dethiosulfatarculus sandiegensis]
MHWLWWLQIGADLILLGAIAVLLVKLTRGGGVSSGAMASSADLERFLEEAGSLTQEFDRLLGEKRELVRTTLITLDSRIEKLKDMTREMDARIESCQAPSIVSKEPYNPNPMDEFREKVARLAREGKNSSQIAQATGRPRGEVELVLGLNSGK